MTNRMLIMNVDGAVRHAEFSTGEEILYVGGDAPGKCRILAFGRIYVTVRTADGRTIAVHPRDVRKIKEAP